MRHLRQQPHLAARRAQLAQRTASRPIGQHMVGLGGHHHIHIHAAPAGHAPCVEQGIVGNEIRRDRQDAFLRVISSRKQQCMHGVVSMIGTGRHPLRARPLGGLGHGRQRHTGIAHAPTRRAPILIELRCRLLRQCTMRLVAQVYPCGRIGPVEEILHRQIAAATPHMHTIGHRDLAVIAQIESPLPRVVQQRHEAAHAHALAAQSLQGAGMGLHAADGIHQQTHAHATLGAAHQSICHRITDLVIAEDEGAQIEPLFGTIDQREQTLQGTGAVFVPDQHVVVHRRGKLHAGEQLRGPHRPTFWWMLDGAVQMPLRSRQLA